MANESDTPTSSLPFTEDVHRMVRELRVVGILVSLALLVIVIGGLAGLLFRALRPVRGSFGPAIFAGVVAVLALAAGVVIVEVTNRKARKARSLETTSAIYKTGCLIAGGVGLAAGCVSLVVLLVNGISRGLWLPQVLVLTVNVLELLLAVPRVRHLRRLHYRPVLPVTRV